MAGELAATLPETWEVRRLDEVATIIDSLHKTPSYSDMGSPMVRVTDVQGGFLDLSKTLRVSEEVFQEFTRRYAPKKGDMVFSRVGSYGNVSYARTDTPFCLGQNTALISPRINGRFLHLFLQSAEARWQIEQVVVGSTQKTISLKSISALQIPIPPPGELEAIAAVLGALDDKIELNRRMNATLEAMARALFQSWFVDFDPVRAKLDGRQPPNLAPATATLFPDSFQDSELGHIPKGWEVKPLSEAFDIKDGATFQKEDRIEIGSIIAFGANGPVGFSRRANVNEPCIALGKIGSCGSLHRSWSPCWVTNNAFIVRPHRGGSLEFVWRTLCTIEFSQFIGGSANPYMPLKNFGHTPVIMPPAPLLDAYQERAGVLAAKIVKNDEQSRTLATLRDTLLPKLLSGELSLNTPT